MGKAIKGIMDEIGVLGRWGYNSNDDARIQSFAFPL